MKNLGRAIAVACGALVSAALPSAGQATTYAINWTGLDPVPGGLVGTVYHAGLGGGSGHEDAGVGRILLTGVDQLGAPISFETYCVDLFDWLGNGPFSDAPLTAVSFGAAKLAKVRTFLSFADAQVTNAAASAAAQLGVWEILYEGDSNSWDVTSGEFYAAGGNLVGGDYNSLALANDWLADLAGGELIEHGHVTLNLLMPQPGNQPQVFAMITNDDVVLDPVPEPASWTMMILGFGAVGYGLRRRRPSVSFG